MIDLDLAISKLKFVGPKNEKILKKLGIKTVENLLWHLPARYDDYSTTKQIGNLNKGDEISIKGTVVSIENRVSWSKRRMVITTAKIADESGEIRAIWFNQPYLEKTLQPGTNVGLAGIVKIDKSGPFLSAPTYEKISLINPEIPNEATTHTGRLVPKYPETQGVTSKYLRFLIKPLLRKSNDILDPLPEYIKKNNNLLDLDEALRNVHFPENGKDVKSARERLAFDQVFLFQLKTLRSRRALKQQKAPQIVFEEKIVKEILNKLPFELTKDQKISAFEILKDMEKPYPMNRLLNGDVGSGKTVVALLAAYQAAKAGFQVAFMAPTEILAQQHFNTISSLLADSNVRVDLLTSSTKGKKGIISLIKNEFSQIVIGTHALIQKEVSFPNLGLVIVDEQHRFGIEQRAALLKNKKSEAIPHLLSMTATPIPRSLALTMYGDLDISLIQEKPKGRQKIETKVVTPKDKSEAYGFIDKEIEKGRQVFMVCPRIESSDPQQNIESGLSQNKMNVLWQEVKAVNDEYEKLNNGRFKHRNLAMLHGKLKPKEKEEIMNKFKNHETDMLISTSVIEVGVDMPNATVMAIESAERFGLAQLHQFRGRVGRGEHQSYCLLMSGTNYSAENKRLRALVNTDDGFKLAEMDLEIRGPGQFFGTQQSGIPDLPMISLTNIPLIKKARQEAKRLLKEDPNFEKYPELKARFIKFQNMTHFE